MRKRKDNIIVRILGLFFEPIRKNSAFFIFMFLLGIICTYAVVPNNPKAHAYHWAWPELFFDLYLLCVVLSILPKTIRKWVKRLFYVIAYGLALVDVYCFSEFGSTLNPTMLLLVGETNSREASEFLSSFLSFNMITGATGWILLLLLAHIAWSIFWYVKTKPKHSYRYREYKRPLGPQLAPGAESILKVVMGIVTLALVVYCGYLTWTNKQAMARLMSYDRIGDVEHELTRQDKAELYQPVYRLLFSIYANRLTSTQVGTIIQREDHVEVDSCSFKSPNIVMIIGESYNRHHAQLYGYDKPTTPRQLERAKNKELYPFTDVISPWNLTSFVFKHLFSLYCVGDSGEWSDYPLFPEVFRKAGYHVTFLTNQFLPQAKEAVYDFSGGFFLNNPELSKAMFDTRNTKLSYFDEGLLKDFDQLKSENTDHNLIIFHLKGQHLDYRTRCPKSKMKWKGDDYDRPKLSPKERQVLAYYDNSLLYNDSIVDQIIRRFEQQEAIIFYVPDHGEQVYDNDVHFICRNHNATINAHMARNEYDIPFWIYMSPSYKEAHPDVVWQVEQALHKPYMTDAIAHTLVYLAGIHTKAYRPSLNLLSIKYDAARKRIIKNETDYDEVIGNKENEKMRK